MITSQVTHLPYMGLVLVRWVADDDDNDDDDDDYYYYYYYGRTLSDASMLCFADVFIGFFMAALVGQTAERIFTKLSHVVDISCYLQTY